MIALRLGFQSVIGRGWRLGHVMLPIAVLFAMLTFMLASETTVRQLLAPGIVSRSFRIGAVDGLAWEARTFSKAELNRLTSIPGVTFSPSKWDNCFLEPTHRDELVCGIVDRVYIQIWAMDEPISDADLDRWDAVKNGAIVTRAAASAHHWKVGDHISVLWDAPGIQGELPMELEITSIADKYIDTRTVYVHMQYWEQRYGLAMRSWAVWALVDTAEHRDAAMAEVEARWQPIHRIHDIWKGEATQQAILSGSQMLRETFRLAGGLSFMLIVCLSVALLIVAVEQRRVELATLLAIGFRRGVLARSILVEGILLLLPAALIGAGCIWIPFHDRPIMFDLIFHVRVSAWDAGTTILVGAVLGACSASISAWRVYHMNALESLRS